MPPQIADTQKPKAKADPPVPPCWQILSYRAGAARRGKYKSRHLTGGQTGRQGRQTRQTDSQTNRQEALRLRIDFEVKSRIYEQHLHTYNSGGEGREGWEKGAAVYYANQLCK